MTKALHELTDKEVAALERDYPRGVHLRQAHQSVLLLFASPRMTATVRCAPYAGPASSRPACRQRWTARRPARSGSTK